MRIRSPIKRESPTKKVNQLNQKKQIEATLNELHRLQSQIYQLNIPQNPHSSAPVKKQIKQLAYLYQNMTKPKQKNKLNIEIQDIQEAFKIINESSNTSTKVLSKSKIILREEQKQIKQKIQSKKLGKLIKDLYHSDFDVGLVNFSKDSKAPYLTAQQVYQFVNYNEFDQFDPLKDTYELFTDDKGQFNFKKFNQINDLLGLPKINNESTLKEALGMNKNNITFEQFTKLLNYPKQ